VTRFLNSPTSLACAAVAVLCASASTVSARGIAVDQGGPPPHITSCALGSLCAAQDFGGVFTSVYVYDDGVASFGQPLPAGASVAGGVSTLGSAFIAPGFSDLSGSLDYVAANAVSFNQGLGEGYFDSLGNPVTGELRLDWVFGPAGNESIFELDMVDQSLSPTLGEDPGVDPSPSDTIGAALGYGSDVGAWFNSGNGSPAFLPPGTEVAWDIGGVTGSAPASEAVGGGDIPIFTFQFSNVSTTPVVPEPSTWSMMIVGLGFAGGLLRGQRRSRPRLA